MRHQTIQPHGIDTTNKFGNENQVPPQSRQVELEILLAKLKAKRAARIDELDRQIEATENELKHLKS